MMTVHKLLNGWIVRHYLAADLLFQFQQQHRT